SPIRSPGWFRVALLSACFLLSTTAEAQFTTNFAPRISMSGVSASMRADTLCVTMSEGGNLAFSNVSVADADVGAGIMHARVELEPGLTSNADVIIPGLAGLPGITIIREEPDRIRFDAPLSSVNAAL